MVPKALLKLSVLLVLVAATCRLPAQQKSLENYFSQIKGGKQPNIPAEFGKPENATAILNLLPLYLKDSTALVRGCAASLSRLIGVQSKTAAQRSKAVQQLVAAAKDKDSGNAGAALMFLSEFRKSDFSLVDQDTLFNMLKRKAPHLNLLIRLMGYLEIQSSKNELFNLSQTSSLSRRDRWAALLALARLGDQQAIDNMMARVRKMPVTDAVVYEVFPDLIYTRTHEATDYMIEALYSDSKNCESANSESSQRIPCAYRVMEMLAPVIETYPLKLSESGDIDSNDYPMALETVRAWFKVNRNYKISKEKF